MGKGIVLQSVDSVRRDLEWRIYMAYKLSQRGYGSVIGPKEEVRRVHAGTRNCIFLGRLDSNTGRMPVDREYLDAMKQRGTSLYFIHDEGALYYTGEYEESVKRIYPEEYFSIPFLKKIFFWGDMQKQYFKSESYSEKLKVSGFPRFDLYQPELADIDNEKVSCLERKYGKYILICGRFAAVNTVPDDPGYLSQRLYDIRVEGGSLDHKSREQILTSMFESWEKAAKEFASFLPAIAKLAMANPDVNFVVRPHPAERQSVYKDALAHFSNVFLDKEGDVRPFVRAAKLVVHSECTTGIEAEIARVPNINFRPCMNDSLYEPYTVSGVNQVGMVVGSYEDLEKKVSEVIADDFRFHSHEFGVHDYILNVSPEVNAADLIISEIESSSDSADAPSRLISNERVVSFVLATLRLRIKNFIKRVLGKMGHSRFNLGATAIGDLKNSGYDFDEICRLWVALGGDRSSISFSSGVLYVKAKEDAS